MALQKWSRIKPLKDPATVSFFEEKYSCALSGELKQCILDHNGGRPNPDTVTLPNGEENDVKSLLSFNEDDTENIYKVIHFFIERYSGKVIPFASDSAGNYYCEYNGRIVLWTQDDELLPVCDHFTEFLESLHGI